MQARALFVPLFSFALLGFVAAPAKAATPLCFGQPATIVGTAGSDSIVGTAGADVIWGGGGDDEIYGEFFEGSSSDVGAADLICGFTGEDRIFGGLGNDRINGGDGNDRLSGDWGADVVQGNAGNDVLRGDFYEVSFSDVGSGDILRGHGGADSMWDVGRGTLEGGPGRDSLTKPLCGGGSTLRGGAGNDLLEAAYDDFGDPCPAAERADLVHGNDGQDTATVSWSDKVWAVESLSRLR